MTKKAKIELIIKILLILVFVPVGVVSLAAKKEATWSGTYETDKNNTTATGSPFSEEVSFRYKTKGFYVDGDTIKFGWHDQQYGNDNDTYSDVKRDFTNKIPDGGTAGTDISEPTFSIPGLYRRYARLFYLEDGQENEIGECYTGKFYSVNKDEHGMYTDTIMQDPYPIASESDFNKIFEDPTNNYKKSITYHHWNYLRDKINKYNNGEAVSHDNGDAIAEAGTRDKFSDGYTYGGVNFSGQIKLPSNILGKMNKKNVNIEELGCVVVPSSGSGSVDYYSGEQLFNNIGEVLENNSHWNKITKREINPISPTSPEDNSEEPVNLASFSNKNLAYAFSFFDMCKEQEPNYSQQVLTESLIGNGLVKQDEKNLRNSII